MLQVLRAQKLYQGLKMASSDFTIAAKRDGKVDNQQLFRLLSSGVQSQQQKAVKDLDQLLLSAPYIAQTVDAKTLARPLCSQLSAGETDIRVAAASTLSSLAKAGSDNQQAIAEAGIQQLTHQAQTDTPPAKRAALTALAELADNHQEISNWLGSVGLIQNLQQALPTLDEETQLAALSTLDSLARTDARARQMIGTSHTLSYLVQLLGHPSYSIQHAAASALADIALTSRDQVNVNIVMCGALPALLAKLEVDSERQGICHQACRALCNLSGDNDECDEAITRSEAVPHLVTMFQHGKERVAAVAAKTLGNLALYSVENQQTIAKENTIDTALAYLERTGPTASAQIKEASCRLVHCLLMNNEDAYCKVVELNGVQKLVFLLNSRNVGSTAALRQAAAGALSHLICPKKMPYYQQCNQIMNSHNARSAFNRELDNLHAKHQASGHDDDMVTDQMTEVHLADNSEGVSAAPADSDDDQSESDNEDVAGVQNTFQQMQM